jgi:hypothetical protein
MVTTGRHEKLGWQVQRKDASRLFYRIACRVRSGSFAKAAGERPPTALGPPFSGVPTRVGRRYAYPALISFDEQNR